MLLNSKFRMSFVWKLNYLRSVFKRILIPVVSHYKRYKRSKINYFIRLRNIYSRHG